MSFFDEVDAEADRVGASVRLACQQMPDPEPLTMFDDVLTAETRQLAAERSEFAAYLDSFAAAEEGR
jgi:pyruvate dehydrogenase E1 component alpha subunit